MYDSNNPLVDSINRSGMDPLPEYSRTDKPAEGNDLTRANIEAAIAGDSLVPPERRSHLKRETVTSGKPLTYHLFRD